MKSFTKFTLQLGIYFLVVGYICADLFLFNGPINRRIQSSHPDSPESIAKAKANGVVARVFGHQITRSQLDRAVYERLFLDGKSFDTLSPNEKKLFEYAALGDLIDHELMRVKVKVNSHKLKVTDEEIDTRLERFAKKFLTREELEKAMYAQGIGNIDALRNRIAARIQQEKYIAMRVDPLCVVSDQEVSDFYQNHREELATPARIRLRHIFIPTLHTPASEAKQTLQATLKDMQNGSNTFAQLAQSISKDPATNQTAGDLGWMSRSRLPEDFAKATFDLPLNQPTLIETKIGCHIVEVRDRRPEEIPSLDLVRAEIHTALTTAKRHQAVTDFRSALRRFEEHKIDIFHDQLGK
jgi:parvulin-like peptidyl-prolyl isomerase